jgi:hypothetical protein
MSAPNAIRQKPLQLYNINKDKPFFLNDKLLKVSQADWMTKSLEEGLLESAPQSWTKDEWIFTPLEVDRLPDITLSQKLGSVKKDSESTRAHISPTNVSLSTSALRSRLECNPITLPASGWLNQAADVYPDRTNQTLTGFSISPILFGDELITTPVLSSPRQLAYCVNGIGVNQPSVVAYWSSNSTLAEEPLSSILNGLNRSFVSDSLLDHGAWYHNFTIKWIVGPGAVAVISGADQDKTQGGNLNVIGTASATMLYFPEEPRISLLNCVPVIEYANATVSLSKNSGRILEFELLGKPEPLPGAFDHAFDVLSSTEYSGFKANLRYVEDLLCQT